MKRKKSVAELEQFNRKRRTMSICIDPSFLNMNNEKRQMLSESNFENVVMAITNIHTITSRSYDSMIQNMSLEAEKEELLKLSEDMRHELESESMSVSERVTKLLELTTSDIKRAQSAKADKLGEVFSEDVSGKI